MKTLKDLFELILSIEEANEGKMLKYHVSVDTFYKTVRLQASDQVNEGNERKLSEKCLAAKLQNSHGSSFSFESEAKLQECYWTLFNNTRHNIKS